MKTWYDVTKEDLEIMPGVYDQKKIDQLNTIEYLDEIEDLVECRINDDPILAPDQMENVFVKICIEQYRIFKGRSPEPEEIMEYLRSPEVVKGKHDLLYISKHVNDESWPEFKREILVKAGITD